MLEPTPSTSTSLLARYARLSTALNMLGQRLNQASSAMLETGALPSPELLEALQNARQNFDGVRSEIVALARAAHIDCPRPIEEITSLHDLMQLLDALEDSDARDRAIQVLQRVEQLSHRELDEFAPLLECQARARALKSELAVLPRTERHPQGPALANNQHAYAHLLELVEQGDSLDDQRWQQLEESVANECGRPLAVAAVRGKLLSLAANGVVQRRTEGPAVVEIPAAVEIPAVVEIPAAVEVHAAAEVTLPIPHGPLRGESLALPTPEVPVVAEAPVVAEVPVVVAVRPTPVGKKPHASRSRGLGSRVLRIGDGLLRALLGAAVLGAALILTPLLFGWQIYAVDGGSMEPTIALGSVIAVQPVSLSDLGVGDIITFSGRDNPNVRVTHRVVAVELRQGREIVRTKGDANSVEDAWDVAADQTVGRVRYYLPYAGFIAEQLSNPGTKFVFAGVIGALLLSQIVTRGGRSEVMRPLPST